MCTHVRVRGTKQPHVPSRVVNTRRWDNHAATRSGNRDRTRELAERFDHVIVH